MHSIEWAAGLFEGEGCIYKKKDYNGAAVYIEMTDKDVLDSFAEVFPGGTWHQRKSDKHKQRWSYQISRRNMVIHALSKMLPYFHNRRAYKALNILDDLELS